MALAEINPRPTRPRHWVDVVGALHKGRELVDEEEEEEEQMEQMPICNDDQEREEPALYDRSVSTL